MLVQNRNDAGKCPIEPAAALRLLESVDRVVSIRGAHATILDLRDPAVTEQMKRKAVLGPTGRLRAPAIHVGRTLVVGFHPASYADVMKLRPRRAGAGRPIV